MPKTPDSNLRAIAKYNKEKTVSCNIRLNRGSDADIIAHLETVPAKATYIKQLIRADMEKQ